MIRLAVLETEEVAKSIIFEVGKKLKQQELSFQYFTKISEFAKIETKKDFSVIFFHEKFNTPRITQSFILQKPQRIVIFTCSNPSVTKKQTTSYERILYIDRAYIKEEIARILPQIEVLLKNREEYFFSYNNIQIPLEVCDILYIEKEGKNVVYHTLRGEFRERKSMKEVELYFNKYDFIRVHTSYLLNLQYVSKFEVENVYLQNKVFPFARARRKSVINSVIEYGKNNK